MNVSRRFPAIVAYLIPVLGWAYLYFFQRRNPLAMFHLRQAVGLLIFLIGVLIGWGIIAWGVAWLPYMGVLAMALFTLVIAAYLFGAVLWLEGLWNALREREVPLPLFGQWANRLPLR